jgi:hypothetical protein
MYLLESGAGADHAWDFAVFCGTPAQILKKKSRIFNLAVNNRWRLLAGRK